MTSLSLFVRQCLRYLGEERPLFIGFLCLSLLGALTEGLSVTLLVPILDGGDSNLSNVPVVGQIAGLLDGLPADQRLQWAAAALMVALILRGGIQYSAMLLAALMPLRIKRRLANRCYSALMGLEMGYVINGQSGQFMSTVTSLPIRVGALLKSFSDIIWNGLVVLIYGVLMAMLSVPMTILAGIFLMGVSLLVRRLASGPLQRSGQEWSAAEQALNQVSFETMNGMKLIRLSVAERPMERLFRRVYDRLAQAEWRYQSLGVLPSPLMATSAGVLICLLIIANASRDPSRDWLPSLLLFLFLLFRLLGPVTSINAARNAIHGHLDAFRLLNEFLADAERHRQPTGALAVPGLARELRLEEVDFAYPGADRPSVRSLSLTIPKGSMVAVVGPSGAGKSTLMALLTRLYDPQSGRILVDGQDLRDLNIVEWRRRISMVSQDIVIFNDTAANNIRFGREDADMEAVRRAARIAAVDEIIEGMPDGYDTLLGEKGMRLSGGQQQRIAIARAILAQPDLLILDEATSQLDTVTERVVQDAIESLRHDHTLLVVAHRLSTVRRADRILVMCEGRLVEQGTHEELVASGGLYATMLDQQALGLH